MNGQKLKSNSLWRSVLAGLLVGTLSLVFGGCTKRDPVRVGLALELTGRQAELGVQERNGVQLAVEAINASGGVAGHPIELIIRDELGTPEGPKGVDRELIDAGVAAIVGHATSKQAKAALPVIDAAHVVLVSPTASSPELSGLSQYFFRVTISNLVRVHAFAQHIYQRRGITRIAAIYDNDNAAYAKVYAKTFADKYQSLGGKLVGESAFSSAAQPDFAPLLSQLRASDAQGLLIIASDVDAALIAQRTRLIGWQVPLFTSGWAQTEILINNGGHAVEGMELEQSFPLNR